MAKAIGVWGFSGHDYSEDELIHASFLMLQHALSLPELERWRLSTGKRISNAVAHFPSLI